MNVLLISPLWKGMEDFFLKGKSECHGMPAFYEVFIRLLRDDKINNIHLLLFGDFAETELIIPPTEHSKKLIVHPIKYNYKNKPFYSLLEGYKIGKQLIRNDNITKLMGFGYPAGLTYFLRTKKITTEQRRIFGVSSMFEDLQNWKPILFLKHPLIYLSLSLPCDNLFITNDGSHGDKVFNKIGSKKTKHFHFLYNGVDFKYSLTKRDMPTLLTFIGRIYEWKGQHYLIDALSILKRKYNKQPKTFIIGASSDDAYTQSLIDKRDAESLVNVHFKGGVRKEEALDYLKNSTLTFSLYQTSNLGNVFIEALSVGTPIVAANINDSLAHIPSNAYVLIDNYNPNNIAETIYNLIEDNEALNRISQCALTFCSKNFPNWEDRARLEIEHLLNN